VLATLTLSNSSFTNNKDGGLVCNAVNENEGHTVNVVVQYCNFTNNSGYTSAFVLDITGVIRNHFIVSIQYSNFVNNSNGAIDINTKEERLSSHLVAINEVLVMDSHTMGSSTSSGAVSIVLNSLQENIFRITNMRLISNNYMGIAGGALYIQTADAENNVFITNCLFQGNSALGEGAAFIF